MSKDFNGASKGRSTFGLFYRFLTMMLMSVYNVLNAALHLFYVLCDGALSERSQMFRVIKKKKKTASRCRQNLLLLSPLCTA